MLGRLAKRLSRRLARRNEQEEIDTLKICLLAHIYHHRQQQQQHVSDGPSGEWDHSAMFAEIEALNFDEQVTRCSRLLGAQLERAFDAIDTHVPRPAVIAGPSAPPSEAEAWIDRLVAEQRPAVDVAAAAAADAAADAAAAADTAVTTERAMLGALGFALQCRASTASASAGDGVFVNGSVAAGSVVALYPGDVYVPEQLDQNTVEKLFEGGNDLVLGRYDRTFIDGASGARARAANPLAVGHLVNHPPRGMTPNVLQFGFDFASDDIKPGVGAAPLPAHLRYLIPNKFATSTDSIKHILVERTRRPAVLVPSLVLVTTRAVQDEELFLNYRLNPRLPAPDWYSSVDPEEDARRWP